MTNEKDISDNDNGQKMVFITESRLTWVSEHRRFFRLELSDFSDFPEVLPRPLDACFARSVRDTDLGKILKMRSSRSFFCFSEEACTVEWAHEINDFEEIKWQLFIILSLRWVECVCCTSCFQDCYLVSNKLSVARPISASHALPLLVCSRSNFQPQSI